MLQPEARKPSQIEGAHIIRLPHGKRQRDIGRTGSNLWRRDHSDTDAAINAQSLS